MDRHLRLSAYHAHGKMEDGAVQRNKHHADNHRQQTSAIERVGNTRLVARAEILRRKTAGAHTQEGEQPIDNAEYHSAHCQRTDDRRTAHVAHDGCVHKSQQRHSDVRHYRRQRNPEYLTVYCLQ